MKYTYSIKRINKEERWLFLSSNHEWDLEESDSFVSLLKQIRGASHDGLRKYLG